MFDTLQSMPFAQRSFDDLGTALAGVTFCVVDLETTGGSPLSDAITEVGAVKVRCGELVGTFQTLVDPGSPVPAFIRLLTGITDEMLIDAPPIEAVLPSLLEFIGGTVLVAHNARFDVSFLNRALMSAGYPRLDNRVVDTALLARKMLSGEVPNHRLHTLATHLRCAHAPCHRAYADVLATTDVLHYLLERAGGFGVTTLEDLVALSSTRIDGTFEKIEMCRDLPRGPGVYRFIGASGETLYVGKAADVRTRVRSYFYGDPRRRMRDLLRQTQGVVAEPHPSTLDAEVAEVRAIAAEMPPFNRAGKPRGAWYVKVDLRAPVPRLHPCRSPKDDGATYLGPVPSMKAARNLLDALRDAAGVHRCSDPARCRGCAFSQMGTCPGPDRDGHRAVAESVRTAIERDPRPLLERLRRRMRSLSDAQRFEEAAEIRRRAAQLASALTIRAELDALRRAGTFAITDGARTWVVSDGRLVGSGSGDNRPAYIAAPLSLDPVGSFWPERAYREARVIAVWIRRNAARVRLLEVAGTWALPTGARPCSYFEVVEPRRTDA